MQEKQSQAPLESDTLRHTLLPLFRTDASNTFLPLHVIEVVLESLTYLQLLKFSVDYFSTSWFGNTAKIFLYLDPYSYVWYLSDQQYQFIVIFCIVYMNLYWLAHLSLFISGKQLSPLFNAVRKLLMLMSCSVFYMPLFEIILGLLSCNQNNPLQTCHGGFNPTISIFAVVSFVIFTLFLLGQVFLNFEFLADGHTIQRLKKSCFSSVGLLLGIIVNEACAILTSDSVSILVFDVTLFFLLLIVIIKEEHLSERSQLLQMSLIGINLLASLLVTALYFLSFSISFGLLVLLQIIMIMSINQLHLHSLRFELQNINKWTSSDIMIRYAGTMRYYLNNRDDQLHRVSLYGYAQIHRQKCDNPQCPYMIPSSSIVNKLHGQSNTKEGEEMHRVQRLIKKIYTDGYKVTPISPELQLQYATFLYQQGEKEVSLKNLLLIKYEELALEQYYRYDVLKMRIHRDMCEEPSNKFLDLVSQLQIKRKEEDILRKFQKSALINLEFWSVLNEDHPDFQKLDEMSSKRVRIRRDIRQNYQEISQYAHSEKITSIYVTYLQAIENDETLYNEIYEQLREVYHLQDKIVLQDWANSSNATLLVSVEDNNYGCIIDINISCASLLGYERYEILNRFVKQLFHEMMKEDLQQFLDITRDQVCSILMHKSGYLMRVKRKCQNYNSLETGMCLICTLERVLEPLQCFLVVADNGRILSSCASIISLLGYEHKLCDKDLTVKDFFLPSVQDMREMAKDDEAVYTLETLVRDKFLSQVPENSPIEPVRLFKLLVSEPHNARYEIVLRLQKTTRNIRVLQKGIYKQPIGFQFQIQATLTEFKYFGSSSNQPNYVTQFSNLNFQESRKEAFSNNNYGDNIVTLRLKENIIQVIENEEESSLARVDRIEAKLGSEQEDMAEKDEEQIFQSKKSFEEFVERQKIARWAILVLLGCVLVTVSLYVICYQLESSHTASTVGLTKEIVYQNLIIGAVSKQQALLYTLVLLTANFSQERAAHYLSLYEDNLNFLQSIKLLGSRPYQLPVLLVSNATISSQTFYSDEFIFAFINNVVSLYSNISDKTTSAGLVAGYLSADPNKLAYLFANSNITKEVMRDKLTLRISEIVSVISKYETIQCAVLAIGLVSLVCFALCVGMLIYRISQQRVAVLQVFLGLNQIQIQQFSSKSEKFLVSLHVEETAAEEIDIDEEVENVKKLTSATFAKKKRFKTINLKKSIYVHLFVLPLIATFYFIQSFYNCYTNLSFFSASLPYISYTSQGDYFFQGGLAQIKQALIKQIPLQSNLSDTYISYYRDYFNAHYLTYGSIESFHSYFTDIQMKDICNGTVQIADSCLRGDLAENGTLLIFTDLVMNTRYLTLNAPLSFDYLVDYEVLSKAHRTLSLKLMQEQQALTDTVQTGLLQVMLIWMFLLIGIALLYSVPILNHFVEDINFNKNILSILPISIAKNMMPLKAYLNTKLTRQLC